jgi:hypothetical protein
VVVHALGFLGSAADSPEVPGLRRLADETGGFRREVRVGGTHKYAVSNSSSPRRWRTAAR